MAWIRLLKESYRLRPVLLPYFVLFTSFGSVVPLLSANMIKSVTQAVAEQYGVQRLILIAVLYSGALLFCGAVKLLSQYKADAHMTYVRMEFSNRLNAKLFGIDYARLEDERFLIENHRAFSSLGSSDGGVEKILSVTFYVVIELLSLCSLSFIFAGISWVLPVFIIAFSLWKAWAKMRAERVVIENKTKVSKQEREIKYVFDICGDGVRNKELRIYRAGNMLRHKTEKALDKMEAIFRFVQREELKKGILHEIGLTALFLALCVAVAHAFWGGRIGVSDIAMYLSAMLIVLGITERIAGQCKAFASECESVAELYDFLDQKITEAKPLQSYEGQDTVPLLAVEHLSFKYPHSERYALADCCFRVCRGERVALVGLNGAGKSTLIKCITGLYGRYEGRIRIEGRDVRSFPREELHDKIGVLYQDVCLYAFTLEENIASASVRIDRDRVVRCLEDVELSHRLPGESLEKEVLKVMDGEGIVLSGGESQRLAFARILYKNPDIILLDEPTSALDSLSEERILSAVEALTKGKTCIHVTHRLSSIKEADRIIVLDESRIAEQGSHAELMEKKGLYYELYRTQARYYEAGRA